LTDRLRDHLPAEPERFRAIFDQAAVGIAEIETQTGRFTRVNRKYCDLVGIEAKDLTATTFMAITHPDDLQADLDNMEKLKTGESHEFSMEKRYIRPDGDIVWVNLTVLPLWGDGEPTRYHVAVVEDVTGRKRAEAELRQLGVLTATVQSGLTLEEVFDRMFEAFRTIIPYDRIGCALLSDDGATARSVWLRSTRPEVQIPVGYSARLDGSSLKTVLESGRPRILNDLEVYLREHPGSENTRRIVAEGMRSSLTCPLIAMGKPVGFLFFSSTEAHTYDDAHVDLYLQIAEHISLIVEKGRLYQALSEAKHEVEVRNRLIAEVFGRYTSEAIVSRLLDSPGATDMGGETRKVTILFSDLSGFTELCARLDAQRVVRLLNIHFSVMADVIMEYGGTIDEFQGDAILVIFGAPILAADDARRALACSIAMQGAMEEVNRRLSEEALPTVAMGIAVHTGEVVAGNIGSHRRAKYGVVGQAVNLVTEMEKRTAGGRISCSEETLREVGDFVECDEPTEIPFRGLAEPMKTFLVRGLRDQT
jgi:PAS domain S-box-containing protein